MPPEQNPQPQENTQNAQPAGMSEQQTPMRETAGAPASGGEGPVATKALVIIGIVLVALLGAGYWYVQQSSTPAAPAVTYQNIRDRLEATNPAFTAGYQALQETRYEDAITQFTAALDAAGDEQQRVAVESMLAIANMRAQHNVTAVQVLKKIAADTDTRAARARAFAIQQIGHLYYAYGSDSAITSEIFKEQPFSSFLDETDANATLIYIFEYSAKQYPLAASLYELAHLYSLRLIDAGKEAGGASTDKIKEYEGKIQDFMDRAEPDVAYMKTIPSLNLQLQEALALKAYALGKLAEAGYIDESIANQAFEASIQAYAGATGGAGGTVRYYYAAQLARMHGESQKDKIVSVLSPLYTDPRYQGSQVEYSLRKKDFADRWQDHNLKLLIDLDPNFKSYLASIGWTDADFETIAKY